jgi:potassium/hydrogen antiporter
MGPQLLFNIGVALILFHGGTGISLQVISRTSVGLGLLVLPGVLLTALFVALVVSPVFGVAFPVALLVGAVLSATDPAILIPLFDRLKLHPKVAQTVIAESAFNDVTGTVLTLTLVGIVEAGGFTLAGPALEFAQELALGVLIGVVAGAVLCYAVASTTRAGIWDESPGVTILAVVALAYFSTESLGRSAYLATFVMGLMVGNMEMLGLGHHDEHARKVLVHQLVYEAVGGYNEGVQVHGCLASVCMGVWSPSMVDEPVDPGHKLAHGVS